MLIMVIDTETSGLPKTRDASIYQTRLWPHVLQLSFLVYDTEKHKIPAHYNTLIRVADSVEIDPGSIKIHGITREACVARGVPIADALHHVNDWVAVCDVVVGHNISFDKRMLIVEYIRNEMPGFGKDIKSRFYCTMKNGVNICKIEAIGKNGDVYHKYPRLGELYRTLFNEEPTGLHDAFADVLACLRCYCAMNDLPDPRASGSSTEGLFG